MKRYARIETGTVVEMMTTQAEPSDLFHASLEWREADAAVEIGWLATDNGFEPPPAQVAVPTPEPDLPQLQAELNALIAKFAAFKAG